jgi:hypothetical protein
MLPSTPRRKPHPTMPGFTVAMRAVAVTERRVKPMKSGRRMPARSATPPRSGELTATTAMETEITRPHQRSPSPVALPTTLMA